MLKFNDFGEFIKKRRLELGYSLSRFCLAHKFCPSHLSKMERGAIKPYQSNGAIKGLALALEIWPGSELYEEMKRTWKASMNFQIPEYFREQDEEH